VKFFRIDSQGLEFGVPAQSFAAQYAWQRFHASPVRPASSHTGASISVAMANEPMEMQNPKTNKCSFHRNFLPVFISQNCALPQLVGVGYRLMNFCYYLLF
jgi:hypothetical protein